MHESESQVAQLCLTLSDPMDCSPPGSSVHGIFQARVLAHANNNVVRLLLLCHFYNVNGNPLQYLAWSIPWMEEPGGLQSMGLLRLGHD